MDISAEKKQIGSEFVAEDVFLCVKTISVGVLTNEEQVSSADELNPSRVKVKKLPYRI